MILLEGSKGRKKDEDYFSASDEEILPLEGVGSSDEEEDEETEDEDEEISDGQNDDRSLLDEEEQEEEDIDEAWGSSRKIFYGADDISDEEDVLREEQEAERLQKKHLARLKPEDFLDTWADSTTPDTTKPIDRIITERLPAPDLSKFSKAELLKQLKKNHPEVPRLANLYTQLHSQLSSLSLLAQRPFHPQHAIIKLKHALLSFLLSSIAIFFALRADSKQRKATEKRILDQIAETETLWTQLSSIFIDENAVDIQEIIETESTLRNSLPTPPHPSPPKTTAKRKRKEQTVTDISDASDDDLAQALSDLKKSRTKVKSRAEDTDVLDFADPNTLNEIEVEEKLEKRKSLRFYASQIESKITKRREKYSGDTEVFKERRNDRNERQIQQATKRGLPHQHDDAALDDKEPLIAQREQKESDNEYYDFVAAKAAKKKSSGKEEYENAKKAARAYLLGETDEVDESGKRLITRQIEKNKGLMPHRSKDVRNPRVKKRKKYEKKKIALKGRQHVYEAKDRRRSAYGGEESGISKNVVRGVKLG